MKKTSTTVTEEFDSDGKLVSRTTETSEEEDTGYIYPQMFVHNPVERAVMRENNPAGDYTPRLTF